jgi:hypothetical protein
MTPRLSVLLGATAVFVASLSHVSARASYVGPWDAAANEAAERAVARLGQKRWLEISGTVRTIPLPITRIESAPDSKSVINNSTASSLPQGPHAVA